jgi:hypothetical protein
MRRPQRSASANQPTGISQGNALKNQARQDARCICMSFQKLLLPADSLRTNRRTKYAIKSSFHIDEATSRDSPDD